MQIAYIKTLYEIMQADSRVVSLLSDSGTDYDAMMAAEMPDQCYNFGIAEQNKVAIAAGMAMCGKIPFVYTSGAFLAYRSFEFIRNDVCYQNQNVKLIGMGSGTSWRTLGPSHHTTEDLALLRAIPNLVVLSPATPLEAAACVYAAYEHKGPVYIRLGMSGEKEYFEENCSVRIGGSTELRQGTDAAIFATGSILSETMEAVEELEANGVHASVLDMYSIKPIDDKAVIQAAQTCDALITVEEHSVSGGLGGAVAEVMAQAGLARHLLRIGLDNRFAAGYGTQKEVRAANGLADEQIARRIADFVGGLIK